MPRFQDITGVILAGGSGKRLGGKEKAFLSFQGATFIGRLIKTFGNLFGRTLIVTNTPEMYAGLGVRVVRDLIPKQGVVQGLITGLFYAPSEWSFVAACDTPLLKQEVVALVLESIRTGDQVVLPRSPDGLQPLTAAYHKSCRIPLTEIAARGERSVRLLYDTVETRDIGPEELLAVDPDLVSFININTPRDMELLHEHENEEV